MFCVVQEIKTHKPSIGDSKRIETYEIEWESGGEKYCSYKWEYSNERFERPLKPSYRISIHQSYRENGKVKKKQFVICTLQYYDIARGVFSIYDEWHEEKIIDIAEKLSVGLDEIYNMVDTKMSPIEKKIQDEYRNTDEYKAYIQNKKIINEYYQKKFDFSKKYEIDQNEYDRCYDVFGKLRNPDYLNKIQIEYKQRKEYEEKSRSYQENFWSNYNKYFGGSSSYCNFQSHNHTDDEKETLKQFYRVLSKKFHPDENPDIDTSKQMTILNRLKDEWGV